MLHVEKGGIVGIMEYKAEGIEETFKLGEVLARTAHPGDILILTGDLGAGKTTLVKGIAQTIGIDPSEVVSPTYTLVQEYKGSLDLIHMDLYRLEKEEEFANFGGLEYINNEEALCVIEWGENFLKLIPRDHLHIVISFSDAQDARVFSIKSNGNRSSKWIEEIASILERMKR